MKPLLRASAALDVTLGKLKPDAAADVIITDCRPATLLTTNNLGAHFLLGMSSNHVAGVIVDGRWALRDRTARTIGEPRVRREATQAAARSWERLAKTR